jgi:hypothetical protein
MFLGRPRSQFVGAGAAIIISQCFNSMEIIFVEKE